MRELAWTAPYMHDGSLATLEDVVRHYEKGGVRRPTRSKDLPQNLKLTTKERADLVAFLQTLSSEDAARSRRRRRGSARASRCRPPPPKDTTVISQADKQFRPSHVRVKAGQTLTVLNDDTPHPQRADFHAPTRFQLRRPGAQAERDDPVCDSRHLPGLLRHPPLHAADG